MGFEGALAAKLGLLARGAGWRADGRQSACGRGAGGRDAGGLGRGTFSRFCLARDSRFCQRALAGALDLERAVPLFAAR